MAFSYSVFTRFRDDKDGAATVWSVFWLIIFLAIGGLAVDSANARRNKEILQTAADTAAHAAVLQIADPTAAKAAAISMANINLAAIGATNVLVNDDIEIGIWDTATHVFTETATNPNAVKVHLRKTEAVGNAVPTFLLGIVGLHSWDVSASSIVQVSGGGYLCDDEDGNFTFGIHADNDFATKSMNNYTKGMCIHGQNELNMWRQNQFDDDVTLTTNVQSEIDYLLTAKIPHHTETNQNNLRAALEQNSESPLPALAVVNMVTAVQNGTSSIAPQFVSNMTIINKTYTQFNALLTANTLENGRIYNVTGCTASSTSNPIVVPSGRNITGIVLVTSCKITFSGNNQVTNSVIATKNTTSTSISGGKVTFGISQTCSIKGDAQILAAGSMTFGANSQVNGSVLTAQNDITFSSTGTTAPAPTIRAAQVHAGRDFIVNATGQWNPDPALKAIYNAHVQFYEPNSRTYQYYDTWFGQDYIGATFQGCAGSNQPKKTTIVG